MRYRVRGISRNTGVETTLVIDAKHHEAAAAIAERHLVVSEVVPEGGLAEPEVFDRNLADDGVASLQAEPLVVEPAAKTGRSPKLIWFIVVAILLAVCGVMLVWRWL